MPGPRRSVIVAGARTPVGRFLGGLAPLSGSELGALAIAAALERSQVAPQDVQYVLLGQVLQAGAGQLPARQASLAAGIPAAVPAVSVNKVCLSGLTAIAMADQLIRAGEFDVVVAGGMESMSRAPHLLPSSRTGTAFGDATLVDHLGHDGLWDAATNQPMGALTESCNTGDQHLSRQEQDAFAARSHRLAAAAWDSGRFAAEVVPVTVPTRRPGRRGDVVVDRDEGIRTDTTAETLARLRPAFAADGTITAGSASQLSDGAAAVVVMDRDLAEERGLRWLAEIGAHGVVAGPDSSLQQQPAAALAAACARDGIDPRNLDLVEINEAFAAVGLASARSLGLDPERVNVDGGAIAIGHPLGASGARIVLHLAHALAARGGGVGGATLCGGGGQGDALLLRVPPA